MTVLGLDRTDISCTVAHKWDVDFFSDFGMTAV